MTNTSETYGCTATEIFNPATNDYVIVDVHYCPGKEMAGCPSAAEVEDSAYCIAYDC